MSTPTEMCRQNGTKQCAAICLSYSCLIELGECPAMEQVWTDKAIKKEMLRRKEKGIENKK